MDEKAAKRKRHPFRYVYRRARHQRCTYAETYTHMCIGKGMHIYIYIYICIVTYVEKEIYVGIDVKDTLGEA